MARTYRRQSYRYTWDKPRLGKSYKKALHKAERKLARGTGGRERSVVRLSRECNWKGT